MNTEFNKHGTLNPKLFLSMVKDNGKCFFAKSQLPTANSPLIRNDFFLTRNLKLETYKLETSKTVHPN